MRTDVRHQRHDSEARLLGEELDAQLEDLIEGQALLEESRDRYASLFDKAPVACVTTDRSGIIEELNGPAATLLGMRPTHAKGTPLRTLLTPAGRRNLAAHLRQCDDVVVAVSEAVVQPPGDAPAVPVELRSRLVSTEPGRIVTVLEDCSVRKRLEADLRRLEGAERSAREASKAKDDFIAMLSHELRTPLTPVLVAATTLRRGGLPPEKVAAMCESIVRNVLAEVHLVDDLLDVTRIAHGKIQIDRRPTDLHDLVQETLEEHVEELRAKALSVVFKRDADRHHTNGDPLRLRQVLENLIKNAIKFSVAKGRIVVTSWNRGGSIVLEVRDSGVGIEAEALARVFNPFEQARQGGTKGGLGLGLAISRGIIELHGGTIECHSSGPGKGARFVIQLDACQPPALAPQARPTRAGEERALGYGASGTKPSRVLLVDDNKDIVEVLRHLLELEGHDVVVASSAEEALANDPQMIDVVISDVGLPRMDGYDFIRRLHQRRDVPAIALSGYGTEQDRRASAEAGYMAHLTKPVDGPTVMRAIESALDSVRHAATVARLVKRPRRVQDRAAR